MCVESITILEDNDTASLGVFETFKTQPGVLTGMALRQRKVLGALAGSSAPETRTRTGISQYIANDQSTRWKNVYSGIFHDIDSIFIPLELVEEAGRVPPKRGPKALQELGIPYYHLTREGKLVEIATGNKVGFAKRLAKLFADSGGDESKVGRALVLLSKFAPTLARLILEEYVKAYCEGKVKRLLPLTAEKLGTIKTGDVGSYAEFLVGVLELKDAEKERVVGLLTTVSGKSSS